MSGTHDLESAIAEDLARVDRERRARAATPGRMGRVQALKAYQQDRFSRTHADLLLDSRFGAAARFFLAELYGPQDFTERDAQFLRIVPALVRLFPRDIVETVARLARLHALSESLDSDMAAALPDGPVRAAGYVAAWKATGREQDRACQLDSVLAIGRALDRHTRSRLLRASLKAMRGPARAAGMGRLQVFLEAGFEAFVTLHGAAEFLGLVEQRERALAARLFDPAAASAVAGGTLPTADPLARLP